MICSPSFNQYFALRVVRIFFIGLVLAFAGCSSAERTAKTWVGSPLQRLLNASGGETTKSNDLPNGNSVYVTSDHSMQECKTYWEVDRQNIIVGYRRERGSWKCD
jgi:hypothetical protein